MNLSRKWLSEFVSVEADDKEFAESMTLSGSKVELTHDLGAEIQNVVVGKVLSMEHHPDSDHMWVCQIDVGREEPVQIVTGAWNVHIDDLVPVAMHKSTLPGGKKIEKGKLRGVVSNGMLCGLSELGLDTRDFPYAVITPAAILGDYKPLDKDKSSISADIQPGDKIAVCISGGKDSMLMAKLLQELQRHGKYPFELVFLVMNPGYNADNWKIIQDNAKVLGIPLTVFESDIFNIVAEVDKNPCYLCARMRRGYLYSHAKELGCNKIALGHHFDDVIETVLMGMLYSGKVETMMPKLHSKNFEGMELIRPMYMVKEADIKAWRDYHQLHFIQCACRFTENCATCGGAKGSKRDEMKELVAKFRETSDVIEYNIFNSVQNGNLRTIIGYHKDDMEYNFLDDYDDWGKTGHGENSTEVSGESES